MSIKRQTFTFGGVNSSTYGVYISGDSTFDAPARSYEMIQIPGRSGDLAIDNNRYENLDVTYPGFIFRDFDANVQGLRNALLSKTGYQRLVDTYHPDEFRLGIYQGGLEVDPAHRISAGSFDVTFNCKPQRFLVSGESAYDFITSYQGLADENGVQLQNESGVDIDGGVTLSSNIVNPTLFPAKPLIKAKGPGQVSIGNHIITISGISSTTNIYIDCETMEIYTLSGTVVSDASWCVSFNTNDFPEIPAGTSGVTYTTETLEIIPRWWRL